MTAAVDGANVGAAWVIMVGGPLALALVSHWSGGRRPSGAASRNHERSRFDNGPLIS